MERNHNWPAIAALILAGMALLVALAGPLGPNFDFSGHIWRGTDGQDANAYAVPNVQVAPVAPVAPQGQVAPVAPVPGFDQSGAAQAAAAQAQADAQAAAAKAQAAIDAARAQAQAAAAAAGKAQSVVPLPGPPAALAGKWGQDGPPFFRTGPMASRFADLVTAPFRIAGALIRLGLFVLVLALVFRFFRRRMRTSPPGPQASGGPGTPIQL